MFEKIVLRRSESGLNVSAGDIAEALLYYQNAHIIIDFGTFKGLLERLGMERLLSLLQRPNVSAVYCEQTLGISTQNVGTSQRHSLVAVTHRGNEKIGALPGRKKGLEYILQAHGYQKRDASRFVERFRRIVPVRKLTDDYYVAGGILNAAKLDLLDLAYVRAAVRRVVGTIQGALPYIGESSFDLIDTPDGFQAFTDIDFDSLNARRRVLSPPVEPISVAHLLLKILEARADITLAAFYGGDFYTSSVTSEVVRLRYSELLRRAGISADEKKQFQDIALPDCPSVKEVIDSGERSFDELLVLLDKSQRFRDWIRTVGPDERLATAYVRDITAEGWIGKLPTKALRYVLVWALSAADPLTGRLAGAVNTFLLDKVLGGWRPNHFVHNRLKPFVLARDGDAEPPR